MRKISTIYSVDKAPAAKTTSPGTSPGRNGDCQFDISQSDRNINAFAIRKMGLARRHDFSIDRVGIMPFVSIRSSLMFVLDHENRLIFLALCN